MTSELRANLQASLGAAYTLERELGGGGMSRVFVAEDTALRRRIVVKVLPPEMAAEISAARFQREIALVARLQHPHIVPLLAAGETGGIPFFTMPLVEGESLRTRLARDGEFPVAEAVRLLREIATALAYAHDQNVVHRDIKPDNILITGGIALVTDFGVAKALVVSTLEGRDGLTSAGIALGTPAYMAPEQASADPTTDHRADLYAFGAVAYEMLAGSPPFAGRTTQGLIAAHLIETPEWIAKRRPALPPTLAALIMRCLEKRPADRPQTAGEIVQVLDSIATPTSTSVAGATFKSPGRTMRALIAALGLLVAATGTWLVRGKGAQASPAVSKRVLVYPFENLTGDARFDHIGRIAADRLAQSIAQVGAIDVVPSNTVLMMLRDTVGSQNERLQRLTNITHAGLLVSGTVLLRRDSLVLQAQVTDTRTGTVAVSLQPASGAVSDPIAVVDALGDRLLGALLSRELPVLGQGTRAPTYPAYREFAAGFERFTKYGDTKGARPFFARAIALDSAFARAYLLLARQYISAGEYAQADSVLGRMRRLPDELTAAERIQTDYTQTDLDGDLARGLQIQQQIVARDSNPIALYLIAETANSLLQPRVAIAAIEHHDSAFMRMGGSAARFSTLALADAYHEVGAHDRELRLLSDRRALFTAPFSLPRRQLRAYAGLRQAITALAVADTMLRANADSDGTAAQSVITAAEEFRAHGDPTTAARLLMMARTWYATHPVNRPTPTRTTWEGVAMLMSGMPDSAAACFARATADTTLFDAIGYLGLADVARGDRVRARAIADSLGALRRRWLLGANTFWRAAMLGALGERDVAVQLLRQANHEGQRMDNWHYTPALDALHGYPAFDALVRPTK